MRLRRRKLKYGWTNDYVQSFGMVNAPDGVSVVACREDGFATGRWDLETMKGHVADRHRGLPMVYWVAPDGSTCCRDQE